MKKTGLWVALFAAIAVAGCTLETPLKLGEPCDEVAFVWPDEAGSAVDRGVNATYDYYLEHKFCPPDHTICLIQHGVVHRGTVDENGEYMGDVVYPDAVYCSDRKESCPKDTHLVQDGMYCEHDSPMHCGSEENNCLDVSRGVSWAECVNGRCEVKQCLQGFALMDGECKTADQCCGDYCRNCTLDARHQVCSTVDYTTFDCGDSCPLDGMIECYGVCVDTKKNIAYCGVKESAGGVCEMYYCPDKVDGWRDGSCTDGKCLVRECILGYHIVVERDADKKITDGRCEADSLEACGAMLKDCTAIDHATDVSCELGICTIKSCDNGYYLYNNECIEFTAAACGGIDCGPHAHCDDVAQKCVCDSGYADCNGECYDLKSSLYHCGDCSNICTTDKISHSTELVCDNGVCVAAACEDDYHVENLVDSSACVSDTCESGISDCIHSEGTGMVKTCVDGVWSAYEPCGDVSCNNETEQCGVCLNGTKQCVERSVGTCINGRWQNLVPCDGAMVCNLDTCVPCGDDEHVYDNACEKHDLVNCGEHGAACDADVHPGGEAFNCDDGTCKATACAAGYHLYDNGCEKDDVANCGSHGTACDATVNANGSAFNCDSGKCVATSCAAGYHIYNDGCEKDDVTNCGSHGTVCDVSVHSNGAAFNCDDGVCRVTSCVSGNHVYNNDCETTDRTNCGSHGNSCSAAQICNGESCVACGTDQHVYGNTCEANSVTNCGSHGNACSGSTPVCNAGSCSACATGQHLYSGGCEADSVENCGSHGITCTAPSNGAATCTSGSCAFTCNSGFTSNGSACIDNSVYCSSINETRCVNSGTTGKMQKCVGNKWTDQSNCSSNNSCNSSGTACGSCINGTKQCSGRVPQTCSSGAWSGSSECSTTQICSGGSCTGCGTNQHVYGNTCEVNSDSHCGAHGNACISPQYCSGGICSSCASGQHLYNGTCEADSPEHCGTHGNACTAPTNGIATCTNGTCGKSCNNSSYPTLCGNVCVNTNTNTSYCGSCSNSCTIPSNASGVSCSNGSCYPSCYSGYHTYGSTCEADSHDYCGSHWNSCSSTQICSGGSCTSCGSNQHVYGNTCEANDRNNCGAHGTVCDSNKICTGGGCVACLANNHVYNNSCEADSNSNCGSHGKVCSSSQNCSGGSCVDVSCGANQHVYDHSCEADSRANCGSHGNACGDNQICKEYDNVVQCRTCKAHRHVEGNSCVCDTGYGNCDGNSSNGCETDLNEKHWSSCGTCSSGYGDCDNNSSNGCEVNLSANGLASCSSCGSGYTSCGNNKFISDVPFCVHVISPYVGSDGKEYWINDCPDHCNGTGTTHEGLTRAQCSPAQTCYRDKKIIYCQ